MKPPALITLGMVALFTSNALASTLVFWDANGTAPGAGGATPTGTWGVDAYWNTDFAGGGTETKAWSPGDFAVFAAGDDATGAYTVYVSGTVQVADIHVDLGDVTFESAPDAAGILQLGDWENNNTNRLLTAGHKTPAATARYHVPLNGAHNLCRYKRGLVILSATNVYTGSTTIEGGVLQLGNPHVLPSNTTLVLANNDPGRGDFSEDWRYTPAVFATDGFSQDLGPLQLSGADSFVERAIDFGHGASTLAFADSSAEDWGWWFALTIRNYTPGVDKLRFGASAGGLTPAQLGQMVFADFANLPGQIDAQGYVTPALPVLTTPIRHSASSVELNWSAVNGRMYRVQYKEGLDDPFWTDLVPDVFASGSTATHTDTAATDATRYYRVLVLP